MIDNELIADPTDAYQARARTTDAEKGINDGYDARDPFRSKVQPQVMARMKLRASENGRGKRSNTPDLFILNDVLFLSDNTKKLVQWLDLSCPTSPGSQVVRASDRCTKGHWSASRIFLIGTE